MQKLPSLNGLRAISVLLVINSHLYLHYYYFDAKFGLKWLLCEFFKNGSLGVNIFFVISGFLITEILRNEERTFGEISIRLFFFKRVLRIFPAYFFMLLMYWMLQNANVIAIPKNAWLTALTFTKYFNWNLDWYTGHAWSLSIEEQFYLVWPIIFLYGKKRRHLVPLAICIAVPLVRIFAFIRPTELFNDFTLFTRIDAIAIGCLLSFGKAEVMHMVKGYLTWLFLFSIGLLFFMPYIETIVNREGLRFLLVPFGTTWGTLANLCICIILLYSLSGKDHIWHRLLNCKPLDFIGILSYSLYLWQQFFLKNTTAWYHKFPLNILLIVMAALFSYYIIEKPFLLLKKRITETRERLPVHLTEAD